MDPPPSPPRRWTAINDQQDLDPNLTDEARQRLLAADTTAAATVIATAPPSDPPQLQATAAAAFSLLPPPPGRLRRLPRPAPPRLVEDDDMWMPPVTPRASAAPSVAGSQRSNSPVDLPTPSRKARSPPRQRSPAAAAGLPTPAQYHQDLAAILNSADPPSNLAPTMYKARWEAQGRDKKRRFVSASLIEGDYGQDVSVACDGCVASGDRCRQYHELLEVGVKLSSACSACVLHGRTCTLGARTPSKRKSRAKPRRGGAGEHSGGGMERRGGRRRDEEDDDDKGGGMAGRLRPSDLTAH